MLQNGLFSLSPFSLHTPSAPSQPSILQVSVKISLLSSSANCTQILSKSEKQFQKHPFPGNSLQRTQLQHHTSSSFVFTWFLLFSDSSFQVLFGFILEIHTHTRVLKFLSLALNRNGWLKFDDLGMEILSIALPAALALAADPLASLVDTAFIGHIGSVELAAVGVSASVFNLVSNLFNVPLLNITTSFVAEEQALINKEDGPSQRDDNDFPGKYQSKKLLPSVSTSLALAAALGIAEAVALSLGSGILMNIMGIPVDSPMHAPAEHFLTLRAFGAPPIVIALAAQGTFRGFMDTKTPLYAIGAGNFLNAILDPILIFLLGLGIGGAAVSTVITETIAVLITMTLATSAAAKQGPILMAGHQICMEVWLSVSLLTDALALAGQALLASSYSQGDYEQARLVIYRALQIGLGTGIALSMILFFGFGAFSSLFSTDSEVQDIAQSGLLFVAGTQPVNALAFVIDGLYYGVSDFGYAAYSTVLVGLISSVFILVAAPVLGLPGVWTGLFLFMILRVLAGALRLGSKSGPWDMVWYKDGAGD